MPTRQQWVDALRSYIGVKFQHQGRSRAGVDCVGLLACAAADIGFDNEARTKLRDYARMPDSEMFANRITDFLDDKHYNRLQPLRVQAKPGDVLAFWIDKAGLPRHVAVYMGENEMGQTMILHAFVKGRHCVVEMPMDGGFWLQRIWGLFEVPGLED